MLSTIRFDQLAARGERWPAEERAAFEQQLREQYEREGHPYHATARLWDDGIIDPLQTRDVLGLGLAAAANAPLAEVGYGVFRM